MAKCSADGMAVSSEVGVLDKSLTCSASWARCLPSLGDSTRCSRDPQFGQLFALNRVLKRDAATGLAIVELNRVPALLNHAPGPRVADVRDEYTLFWKFAFL